MHITHLLHKFNQEVSPSKRKRWVLQSQVLNPVPRLRNEFFIDVGNHKTRLEVRSFPFSSFEAILIFFISAQSYHIIGIFVRLPQIWLHCRIVIEPVLSTAPSISKAHRNPPYLSRVFLHVRQRHEDQYPGLEHPPHNVLVQGQGGKCVLPSWDRCIPW